MFRAMGLDLGQTEIDRMIEVRITVNCQTDVMTILSSLSWSSSSSSSSSFLFLFFDVDFVAVVWCCNWWYDFLLMNQ